MDFMLVKSVVKNNVQNVGYIFYTLSHRDIDSWFFSSLSFSA